jgi:hypothetical protein
MNGATGSSRKRSLREIRFTFYSDASPEERQKTLEKVASVMTGSGPCDGCFPTCASVSTVIDENLDCWCVGEGCPGIRVKPCP